MALRLPDRWVWDSWYIKENDVYHAFYLTASRGLLDPERRHRNPSVGHAISRDLVNWEVLPDALCPGDSPAWDSWTTWTGSVVLGDDGLWWMFYTGSSREDGGDVQRIGAATSTDLIVWEKHPDNPLVEADSRWYETLEGGNWHDQAWRDPWVFKRDDEWQMLITARRNEGEKFQRGTIGLATSKDLNSWQVKPPIGLTDSQFGQLEVLQIEQVNGKDVLLFCCGARELSNERPEKEGKKDGVYSIVIQGDVNNVNLAESEFFPDETLYAARLIETPTNGWALIGFRNIVDGRFVGELCDPIPVDIVGSKLTRVD